MSARIMKTAPPIDSIDWTRITPEEVHEYEVRYSRWQKKEKQEALDKEKLPPQPEGMDIQTWSYMTDKERARWNKQYDIWHTAARKQYLEKNEAENQRLKYILKEYRTYGTLFKETLETGLPEHSQWGHEISIVEGGEPALHKLYSLTEPRLQALREYLDDMLKKGYIRLVNFIRRLPCDVRTKEKW